jgi:arylsulfatase A-like enzyme
VAGVRAILRCLLACIALCAAALLVTDTLYRLDSMVKAMALHDVAVTVSTMFLLFLAAGAGLALVGTGCALLAWPFRSRWMAAVRLAALVGVVLLVSRAVCHWLLKIGGWETWVLGHWATQIFGMPLPSAAVLTFYYLAVVTGLLAWLVGTRRLSAVLQGLESRGWALAKAVPIVALLAVAVLGVHLSGADDSRKAPVCASEPPPPSKQAVGQGGSGKLPDVVLVTFDALTARDTSLHGYRLPTTPNLEQLAGESDVYEHATSVSNWTRPGTVSILTGRYPHRHQLFSTLGDALALRHPEQTLPDQLRSMGYRTAAVVSNASFGHPLVNGTYRSFDVCDWRAFSPGFIDGDILRRLRHGMRDKLGKIALEHDVYVSGWVDDLLNSFAALRFWRRGIAWNDKPSAPPERTFELARQALVQAGGQPSFVWVHVFAPHAPYLPDAPYLRRFLPGDDFLTLRSQALVQGLYPPEEQARMDRLRLRYGEYILNADHSFGEFVGFLKRSGRWDRTLMIVSADHGESFEDGVHGHRGDYLQQQLVHIPLVVHLPGQRTGRRVAGSASQVDIAPTILSHLNQPVPPWMDGEPLSPEATRGPYRYSMQIEESGIRPPFRKGVVAVTDGRYKLVYSLTRETAALFDLRADPDESIDISRKNPDLTDRLRTAVLNELARP